MFKKIYEIEFSLKMSFKSVLHIQYKIFYNVFDADHT